MLKCSFVGREFIFAPIFPTMGLSCLLLSCLEVELFVVELLVVLWDVVGDILGVFRVWGRSVVYHLSEIQLEKFWGRLFKFYNNFLVC